MKAFRSVLGMTVIAVVAWTSVPASAVPMLRLTDGLNTVTIGDQLAGDFNGASDVVTWIGTLGAWTLNVTTGVSEHFPQIHLDLNSINGNVGSSSPGALTILFTDTDFSLAGNATAGLAVGGVTAGSVEYTSYYDPSNTAFGTAIQLGSTITGSGAFSGQTTGAIPADALFSMTQKAVITHPLSGFTSFNYEVMVPEPGTLALLTAALFGIGFAYRRRLWVRI